MKSNLCDYSDACILVKRIITVPNTAAGGAAVNNTNKKVTFKNFAPFADCITEINNTQGDDDQNIDVVMSMYNLIEYSDACLKTSESLWQWYRDESALNANVEIIDFPANNNSSASFKFKQEITEQTGNGGTKNVELMIQLKYVSNIWRTLEMLINCDISLQLIWSKSCILEAGTAASQNPTFQIDDTKLQT